MNYEQHYKFFSQIKTFKKLCELNHDLIKGKVIRKVPVQVDFYHIIDPDSMLT